MSRSTPATSWRWSGDRSRFPRASGPRPQERQGGWDERGSVGGHFGTRGAAPSVETSDVCNTSDIVYYLDGGTIFPPLAWQLSFVVLVCPWPWQPFFPAQAWPLPWHDPVPLHELMPSQTTCRLDR